MVDVSQYPNYNGPTNAELFVDDVAALRALRRHGLPVPPEFEMSAIGHRYLPSSVERDESKQLNRVVFLDATAAKLNKRGRWVVN